MLTVPQVARRTGRNPETIRRWIRQGKLRAKKIGTQHVIEESDLEQLGIGPYPDMLPVPKEWGWDKTRWGTPMPNVVALIRESRESH
jgi:excisionase family DNA binding protein